MIGSRYKQLQMVTSRIILPSCIIIAFLAGCSRSNSSDQRITGTIALAIAVNPDEIPNDNIDLFANCLTNHTPECIDIMCGYEWVEVRSVEWNYHHMRQETGLQVIARMRGIQDDILKMDMVVFHDGTHDHLLVYKCSEGDEQCDHHVKLNVLGSFTDTDPYAGEVGRAVPGLVLTEDSARVFDKFRHSNQMRSIAVIVHDAVVSVSQVPHNPGASDGRIVLPGDFSANERERIMRIFLR